MTAAGPHGSGRERVLRGAIEYFAAHGIGDVSMRGLAAALGTSHRMLNHYFGSREGLLTAVVDAVEADQRELLSTLLRDRETDSRAALRHYWRQVSDAAVTYGPLFFELSGHAMQGRAHAVSLRESLIQPWLEPLELIFQRRGSDGAQAAVQARISLAVARGLLLDLLLSGDRAGVDAAMGHLIDTELGAR
ncbi:MULTISPECIES: TetR/AcrR family transcriptional regulator [Amycolatopsis]|uniref:TetR/AcrR family transcriptional regulator n=2 Tax=Amycolatopsis TaxID=1813 RepID=A0A8E2B9K5_9PSEU|nr:MULTISPECIES: TetR/AcrR family transcriptional regulator [Amycolatopsis]MBB2505440.1 TetR/AcrR family transcriptional regulator [Amycolatopsis echigonensis]WIV60807.1 TetR/AcrR family transcriptional regulator [Amycolatopsis sp. 2-2]